MPPTRREQLDLDELLSDIYRGIETLPDKSTPGGGQPQHANNYTGASSNYASSNNHYISPQSGGPSNKLQAQQPGNKSLYSRTYVKEYELPASSPLVKQHKQELAALRAQQQQQHQHQQQQQPQRSTLKRHTNTPDHLARQQQQPQSLASFVTSTTPENKRRVRIVDHPDKLAKGYNSAGSDDDYYYDDTDGAIRNERGQPERGGRGGSGGKVKYVNTNKLIYHQERNPDDDDEPLSDDARGTNNSRGDNYDDDEDGDDDIDGVTRVEYYHTTWLDKQLGRASKRRNSKELNERQVKEKAMIEELKRSLKNGAITLRQSFKGKRNSKNSKPSETYDDQILDSTSRHKDNRSVFGSGLATVPRNYQPQTQNSNYNNNNNLSNHHHLNLASTKQANNSNNSGYNNNNNKDSYKSSSLTTPKQTAQQSSYDYSTAPTPARTNAFDSVYQPVNQQQQQTTRLPEPTAALPQQQANYSRTLPHNYQTPKKAEQHQLLQSHYRGNKGNFNTINNSSTRTHITTTSSATAAQAPDTMRNPQSCNVKSPTNTQFDHYQQQQQQQHQQPQQQYPPQIGNTIASIPSATEVVRSALSRSSSQASLHQLNKTINLLPTSPSPYVPSPVTPTQQLKPASPSLSPSPIGSPYQRQTVDSCRMPQQQQQQQQQQVLHGTRTVGRPPQQQFQPQPGPQQRQQPGQQQQQPVYANPHAALMQHRAEQQMRQPAKSAASVREFNELDSLLRSLSPGTSTHITPGYTSKPSQPAFGGYGYSQAPAPVQAHQQQQQQSMRPQPPSTTTTGVASKDCADIYARVRKPQPQPYHFPYGGAPAAPAAEQSKASYLQQHYGVASGPQAGNEPFTIDVTAKKDENYMQRRQELSEFEPPIELLPSMEDYQNISKLNPVKNHYWYKPNMSRDRAISLLKDKPQGTFIVRDSTSFRGAYGLAVKVAKLPKNVLNNASLRNPNADPSAELIRHFLIEPTSNGVRLKGYANEPVFDSLPDLIYQHSLTELALPCKLVIPRADIEDPRFNQKQKQFYDEFLASKEQAKCNPCTDRTSPMGGYRKYPGDVYVHNEHRIIFE